jgi:hypothetical protein
MQAVYIYTIENAKSIIDMGRACNLTVITAFLTGPVDYPFTSRHEGPGFKPQGDIYLKPGFSC